SGTDALGVLTKSEKVDVMRKPNHFAASLLRRRASGRNESLPMSRFTPQVGPRTGASVPLTSSAMATFRLPHGPTGRRAPMRVSLFHRTHKGAIGVRAVWAMARGGQGLG